MNTAEIKTALINALHEGRKVRPKHKLGKLFSPDDDSACALGAIVIGLGYEPDSDNPADENAAYSWFQNQGFRHAYMTRIYGIYDTTLMDVYNTGHDINEAGRLADEAVIKYIEAL